MNKNGMMVIKINLVVLLLLLASGCQTTPKPTFTPSANKPQHEIYAGFTQNKNIPFVMIHRSGESLAVTQDVSATNVTGVVWTSSDGKSIVIYSDSNGRPKSAVVGKDIILYSNYSTDIVDITIIHADGTRELFQSKLDIDLLNKITSFVSPPYNLIAYSIPNPMRPQQLDKWFYIKTSLYILGAASCIKAVPGSLVIPVVGIPLLASACTGFLLETVVRVGNALNLDVGDIQTLNNNLDIGMCAMGSVSDCLNVYVTEAEKQEKISDEINSNPPLIPTPTPKVFPTRTPLGQVPVVIATPIGALLCDGPIPLGQCGNQTSCGFKSDPITGRQPTGNQVCQASGKVCLYVTSDGGVACAP